LKQMRFSEQNGRCNGANQSIVTDENGHPIGANRPPLPSRVN
jgi:hypothetical protein